MSLVTCPPARLEFTPLFHGARKHTCPSCSHVFYDGGGRPARSPEPDPAGSGLRPAVVLVAGGSCLLAGLAVGFLLGLAVGSRHAPAAAPVPVAQQPAKQPAPVPEKKVGKEKQAPRGEKFKKAMLQATAAVTRKDWPEAIVSADEVLALEPGNKDALFMRGIANWRMADLTIPPDMVRWSKANLDLQRAAADGDGTRKEFYEMSVRQYKKVAAVLGID